MKAAGLDVDYIEISPEVDHDSSLAVPILAAYIQKHPDLKAIGTQHGNVTAFIAKALQQAGKQPGQITVGGIDLSPATIDGLKKGYISVTLDQQLYLQGFLAGSVRLIYCADGSQRVDFFQRGQKTALRARREKRVQQIAHARLAE